MSSISPVPKIPWPVSKVQNWLLLLVGVNGPAGPLNSSLHTSTQFVCALAGGASNSTAAVNRSTIRNAVNVNVCTQRPQGTRTARESGHLYSLVAVIFAFMDFSFASISHCHISPLAL